MVALVLLSSCAPEPEPYTWDWHAGSEEDRLDVRIDPGGTTIVGGWAWAAETHSAADPPEACAGAWTVSGSAEACEACTWRFATTFTRILYAASDRDGCEGRSGAHEMTGAIQRTEEMLWVEASVDRLSWTAENDYFTYFAQSWNFTQDASSVTETVDAQGATTLSAYSWSEWYSRY